MFGADEHTLQEFADEVARVHEADADAVHEADADARVELGVGGVGRVRLASLRGTAVAVKEVRDEVNDSWWWLEQAVWSTTSLTTLST